MTGKENQDESEKPAKVWQMNELGAKIDGLAASQEDLKALIIAQTTTHPTRAELSLELEKRDSRISSLGKTLSLYNKVVWVVVTAVIPMFALSLWQLIVNYSKQIL